VVEHPEGVIVQLQEIVRRENQCVSQVQPLSGRLIRARNWNTLGQCDIADWQRKKTVLHVLGTLLQEEHARLNLTDGIIISQS
jgi:hypothetical protein